MFLNYNNNNSNTASYKNSIKSILLATLLVFTFLSCSDDNDNSGPNIDGDLSFELFTQAGVTVNVNATEITGDDISQSTVVSFEDVPEDGTITGDLEDGDFEAYVLQASVFVAPDNLDLTLRLLNNGDVVAETSEKDPEFPELDVWVIEVGDFSGVEDLSGL